jgi:hypothetical protein
MLVLLAITHLQHWRYEGNALVNQILILWVTYASAENTEWCAQTSLRKKIARNSQGALKVTHVIFFSQNRLVLDHLMPSGRMVNGHFYYVILQDKVKS